MVVLLKLTTMCLFVALMFFGGYEIATNYARRHLTSSNRLDPVRLAKIDFWSYLLTSVPVVWAVLVISNTDPVIGHIFEAQTGGLSVISGFFVILAACGVGAGIARRRMSLKQMTET